jgi:SNF2 family DNA or RNA helicase
LQKLQKKKAMTSAANKKDKKKATAKESPKVGKNASKGSDSNADVDSMMTRMLMSLTTNDQIAERIAHGDVGKAESILAKNKMKQLEQLLQGIPDDYDTHQAKADRKKLLEASKRFGHGKVKARNGHWLLTGMKSALLHHQLLAANWMVDRELASSRPYGGLLGDAMGLGKTIEMLACMVGNTPSVQDNANGRKATLIVLPSGVVKQWVTEIKKHVDPQVFEKILQYKSSMEIPMVFLQDSDIVITSYQEVMKSLPFPTTDDDKKDAKDMGIEAWIRQHENERGHLHRIKWYRIVLDEAHAIKNYRSRTSLACVQLDGKFRWAMTGTPLMNSLDELYPYFRFLRVPYSENIDVFRRRFGDPDTVDSNRRLAVILAIIML